MYKIGIIIPYFGRIPNYFGAWYKSAQKNRDVDFLFFTDIKEIKPSENIFVTYCDLEDIHKKIQKCYDFDIAKLDKPYKLCDFKPAYGDIFAEELREYDFWGYCDIDLLFGNIRKFITDDVLENYERCLKYGHLSLYKNVKKINELYRYRGEYPEKNFDEVFSDMDSYYFDEFGGMDSKTIRNNISWFCDAPILNFLPIHPFFHIDGKSAVLEWDNGSLYCITEDNKKEEVLYAHYSKRAFTVVECSDRPYMTVTPDTIFLGRLHEEADIKIIRRTLYHDIRYVAVKMLKSNKSLIKNIKRHKWSKDTKRYMDSLMAERDIEYDREKLN